VGGNYVVLEIFLGVSHSNRFHVSDILASSTVFQIVVICESY